MSTCRPSMMHVPLYLVVSVYPCKSPGSCIPKNQSSRGARLRMAITETTIAFCTFCSYGLSRMKQRQSIPYSHRPILSCTLFGQAHVERS